MLDASELRVTLSVSSIVGLCYGRVSICNLRLYAVSLELQTPEKFFMYLLHDSSVQKRLHRRLMFVVCPLNMILLQSHSLIGIWLYH